MNEYGDVYPCPYLDVEEFHMGNIKRSI
ncbi:MAG: hypothetical protein ACFFAS_03800 [Promethearchaeota archaeon]